MTGIIKGYDYLYDISHVLIPINDETCGIIHDLSNQIIFP